MNVSLRITSLDMLRRPMGGPGYAMAGTAHTAGMLGAIPQVRQPGWLSHSLVGFQPYKIIFFGVLPPHKNIAI
jgi:hypothetical protein